MVTKVLRMQMIVKRPESYLFKLGILLDMLLDKENVLPLFFIRELRPWLFSSLFQVCFISVALHQPVREITEL
jgi:hypothetical protein